MIQTLEEGMKSQSKHIKIPMEIRPFDVGYRIVKNDPDFDIEKHFVEEVAIVNLSKFHSYFEEVE